MNNKERCIKILNDFDENQLASVATILQNIKNFAACVDTQNKNISIIKFDFPNAIDKQKLIRLEVENYRRELEAEKTSQTSLYLGSSEREA
jgi:regulator of replication initiation timing